MPIKWEEYIFQEFKIKHFKATSLLGKGARYKEIMSLSDINSTTIYAGQVLTVPAA